MVRTDVLSRLIWLYFALWLVEGPIRKWIPSLNAYLYVARDPVVIAAYWVAFREGVLRL
jgi:hypothetical protein